MHDLLQGSPLFFPLQMWSKSSPAAWPSASTPKPRTNIWFTSSAALVQPLAGSAASIGTALNSSQKSSEPGAIVLRARPSTNSTAGAAKSAAAIATSMKALKSVVAKVSKSPAAKCAKSPAARAAAAAASAISTDEIPNHKSSEHEKSEPCSTCGIRQKHAECELCKQSACSSFCLKNHPCASGDSVAPTTDSSNTEWFENLLRFPNVCAECQKPASYGYGIDHVFYDDMGGRVTQRFYFCDEMHQMWYLQCPEVWNFYRRQCAYCHIRCTQMFYWRKGSRTYDFCNNVCKTRFRRALKPAEAGGKKAEAGGKKACYSFEITTGVGILSAAASSSVSHASEVMPPPRPPIQPMTHKPDTDTKSHALGSMEDDFQTIGEYEPWMDGEGESDIAENPPLSLQRDDVAMIG
jgi:hypothetical protein